MPKKNVLTFITFYVYNRLTGDAVTNESSSTTTVYVSKDGGSFAAVSSPAIQGIDSTNLPGFYRLTLSAADTDAGHIILRFASATQNAVAEPCEMYFETYAVPADLPTDPLQFPTVAQIAAGIQVPTTTQIADAVLTRSVSNAESSAPIHSLCTIILAHFESEIADGIWKIRRSDGSTPHATLSVISDQDAEAITGVHA